MFGNKKLKQELNDLKSKLHMTESAMSALDRSAQRRKICLGGRAASEK